MTPTQVQNTLNEIGYGNEFTVVFTKKDGTERKITGLMEVPTNPDSGNKSAVPIKVTQGDAAGGWRSFRLDSVTDIIFGKV